MAKLLFDDLFVVQEKDPDGKKFDKVSRVKCRSELFEVEMLLDVNTDIYPLEVSDQLRAVLASTLNLDNSPMTGHYDQTLQSEDKSLMDEYEYVMHGKVFKYQEKTTGGMLRVEVFISFGGLLMQLIGDPQKLEELEVDSYVFLLMRKV